MQRRSIELQFFPEQNSSKILDKLANWSFQLISENWSELLIKIANERCKISFKKLFQNFYPKIVGNFIHQGCSKEIAKELAQDTMIKVWNNSHLYNFNLGNAESWIFIVARNTRYDYLRKIKNLPTLIDAEDLYQNLDDSILEYQSLENLMTLKEIGSAIEKINEDQALIIRKVFFEGMSHQEICDQLNIPLGTVKSRSRLGLESLKRIIEDKSL